MECTCIESKYQYVRKFASEDPDNEKQKVLWKERVKLAREMKTFQKRLHSGIAKQNDRGWIAHMRAEMNELRANLKRVADSLNEFDIKAEQTRVKGI